MCVWGVGVGGGKVITLFLVPVFLHAIPEQPKGGGPAGWVNHAF